MQRCISNRKKQKTKNYSIAVNNEEHSLTITGKNTSTRIVYLDNRTDENDVRGGATICAQLDAYNGNYTVNDIVKLQGKASNDLGFGWGFFMDACERANRIGAKELKVELTDGWGMATIDSNDPSDGSVFTKLYDNNGNDISDKLKDCYIESKDDTTTVTFGATCKDSSSFSTNNCTIPEDTETITVKKWNKSGNAENDKKLAASLADRLNIWDEKNKYIWKDNNDGTLTKVPGLTKNNAEYTLTLGEGQTVDKAKLTDELFKDATKITVKVTEDDDEANTKTKEQAAALQKQLGKNWKVEDDGITLTNVKTQTTDDEVALLNLYDTIY